MKITRAYTLSKDVVDILNTKVNKSQFVERAVRVLHKKDMVEDTPLMEATDEEILKELNLRWDRNTTKGQLLATLRSL